LVRPFVEEGRAVGDNLAERYEPDESLLPEGCLAPWIPFVRSNWLDAGVVRRLEGSIGELW